MYIVTCQPFVGWRNGVARHRPVNKVSEQTRWCHATALEYGSWATFPRSRDDVTCVYVVARRRAAILSDCKGSGKRDVTVLLNNAMTVAGRPLTQLGYISEAISRFCSVPGVTVKKSVFRKQLCERVSKSSTSEWIREEDIAVGSQWEWKTLRVRQCVIIWDINW
jgi:hypothetical protein